MQDNFAVPNPARSSVFPTRASVVETCYERIKPHEALFRNLFEEALSPVCGALSEKTKDRLQGHVQHGFRQLVEFVLNGLEGNSLTPWTILEHAAAQQTAGEARVEPRVQLESGARPGRICKPGPRTSSRPQTHQRPQPRLYGARVGPEPRPRAGHDGRVPFSARDPDAPFADGPPTSLTDSFYFPSTHPRYKEFYGKTDKSAAPDSYSDPDPNSGRWERSRAPSPKTGAGSRTGAGMESFDTKDTPSEREHDDSISLPYGPRKRGRPDNDGGPDNNDGSDNDDDNKGNKRYRWTGKRDNKRHRWTDKKDNKRHGWSDREGM
ncbi:hypothetical protein K505DRAFT_356504 [Melanomma pulvis-pyrius CBS 109.77]|uniref:Uncharacterized protein n=1 Tax=Melanomma pulvis-pyrius CBS 109.77 TaxID=1314802 RepID=A0A6A6XUY6_9PLEO|nr:hypothetical protein K505DRAFT_356504 [Melanomma pulvis-pyrius CBS 109.77]